MEHLDAQLAHRLLRKQLDPRARARWLRHLAQCKNCRDLLANERSVMAVLDLGHVAPHPAPELAVERLLDRVEALAPEAAARRRQRRALRAGGVAAAIGLTLLLVWQLRILSAAPEAAAAELHITPELQSNVVANLDTLATLAADPWLPDQYETVRTLEELVLGPRSK